MASQIDVLNELDMHIALRKAIEKGAGAAALAREAGCSVQFVYAVYSGERNISSAIARALGFKPIIGWALDPQASNGMVYDSELRPKRGRKKKVA